MDSALQDIPCYLRNGSGCVIASLPWDHADILSQITISKRIMVWNIWKSVFQTFSWDNTAYDGGR